MKKLIAIGLCLVLLVALSPFTLLVASADEYSGSCGVNLTWSYNPDSFTLTINGTGDMENYSSANQVPWYSLNGSITHVVVSEGVTSIGDYAFYDLYNARLEEIHIPISVTNIGNYAFSRISFTEITIPDSVTSIGDFAFDRCTNMESVSIGNRVNHIGTGAFNLCYKLQSISIPDSVELIDDYAFYECYSLASITMGKGVTHIGNGAFAYCSKLSDVNYNGTEELRNQILPNSAIEENNEYLLSAQWHYKSIRSGQCGDSLYWLFNPDTNTLTITGSGEMWDFSEAPWSPWFGEIIRSVSFPDEMTSIGALAFAYCYDLKTISIPDSVSFINTAAFTDCTSLSEVTIPAYVSIIRQATFSGCTNLHKISFGKSIAHIENTAFYKCENLKDVYYNGTESERYLRLPDSAIDESNDCLLSATWHYLDDTFDGTIEWNTDDVKFRGATPYVIANGSAQTPRFTVLDADGYAVNPKYYDFEYQENTNAGTAYVIVTFKGGYSGTAQSWFKIYLQPTTQTTVENRSDGIYLTWAPVEGAAGYVIYRRAWSSTTNGWTTFERWNNTTSLNWTDTTVYAGTRYQYGIKAYFARRTDPVSGATIGGNVGDNYNLGEIGPLKTTVRITTRVINSVTAGSKQMTVKWTPSKNFTGYQIKYATDNNFTKNVIAFKISDPKTTQTVIKNLKSGTTYYVTLRSYHEFNGMTYFGEWSNVLSCKVK